MHACSLEEFFRQPEPRLLNTANMVLSVWHFHRNFAGLNVLIERKQKTVMTICKNNVNGQRRQMQLWMGALVIGVAVGIPAIGWIDEVMNFIASVYTRLFQLLAVPTIVLAVITTLASLGAQSDSGRIFRTTLKYTLLTTVSAAAVGLLLYILVAPGNVP